MFGPTTFILSFINRLPSGQIFTTRDLLHTAWRAAVDKALSRLVAKEYIIRLSRGVFIRNDYKVIMPSIDKIAHVKAAAFGKHILSHGADAARQLGLTDTGNKELTFYTTGASSSFRVGTMIIYFKSACLRKMHLNDSKAGLLMRACWFIGKKSCTRALFDQADYYYNRQIKQELKGELWAMPAWLGSFLVPSRGNKPLKTMQPVPPQPLLNVDYWASLR